MRRPGGDSSIPPFDYKTMMEVSSVIFMALGWKILKELRRINN
jgi:hypothetical protein